VILYQMRDEARAKSRERDLNREENHSLWITASDRQEGADDGKEKNPNR